MTADLPQLMFLAGVPASGKTHFGDWLHTEHGAVHLNFDDIGRFVKELLAKASHEAISRRWQRNYAPMHR